MLKVNRETKCDGCPLKNSPIDCIGQADSWKYICGMTHEKVQCDFIVEESEIWHKHQGKPAISVKAPSRKPGGCGCGVKSTAGKVLSSRNKARKK